jgi:predicted membrane channel-forming protein YqfA (hemolysin III family)
MLPPIPLGFRLVIAGVAALAFGLLIAILAPRKDRRRLRLFFGIALAMVVVVLMWACEFLLEPIHWDRVRSSTIGIIAAFLAFILPIPRFSGPPKDQQKSTHS